MLLSEAPWFPARWNIGRRTGGVVRDTARPCACCRRSNRLSNTNPVFHVVVSTVLFYANDIRMVLHHRGPHRAHWQWENFKLVRTIHSTTSTIICKIIKLVKSKSRGEINVHLCYNSLAYSPIASKSCPRELPDQLAMSHVRVTSGLMKYRRRNCCIVMAYPQPSYIGATGCWAPSSEMFFSSILLFFSLSLIIIIIIIIIKNAFLN